MSRSQIIQTVVAIWLTAFVLNGAHAQSPQYAPVGQNPAIQYTGGVQPSFVAGSLDASRGSNDVPAANGGRAKCDATCSGSDDQRISANRCSVVSISHS